MLPDLRLVIGEGVCTSAPDGERESDLAQEDSQVTTSPSVQREAQQWRMWTALELQALATALRSAFDSHVSAEKDEREALRLARILAHFQAYVTSREGPICCLRRSSLLP